jgi:hypothetical protein
MEVLTSQMSNPLDEQSTLLNLATGLVMPTRSANQLLQSKALGQKSLENSVAERLIMNTTEKSFWDTLPNLKIPTFATMSKQNQVKSTEGKVVNVKTDRELFGRLLIAANGRDINLI